MTMTRETTVAKMGCSMKNRENMQKYPPPLESAFLSAALTGFFFESTAGAGSSAGFVKVLTRHGHAGAQE